MNDFLFDVKHLLSEQLMFVCYAMPFSCWQLCQTFFPGYNRIKLLSQWEWVSRLK